MEKETLISNLKQRVGENDFGVLSERTIDNLVEQFMPMFADDEKITDETYALPVNLLKSYAGQYRHDVKDGIGKGLAENKEAWETEQKKAQEKALADALEKAKAEWDATHKGDGNKEPDKQEPDIDKKIQDAITNALGSLTGEEGPIGKLTKQVGDYMAAQIAKEKAANIAKAKSDLRDFLIELGADENKPRVIELALNEVEIGDSPVMSDLQKLAKSKYESLYKDLYGDGGKPFAGGMGNGGTGDSNSELQDFLKRQEEKDKAEASHAEAISKFLQ